ncbi:MAG: ABC transporter substrate-binding protein [Lachnospirales bacterium]
MLKRKILSMVLVSTMLFTSACSSKDSAAETEKPETSAETSETSEAPKTDDDTSPEMASGGVEIEFWNDKLGFVPEKEAELIDAWETASNDTITMNTFVDTASYQTAMSQSIDSNEAPDLVTWWSGQQLSDLARSGKIVDLDDLWDEIIEMGVSPDIKNALSHEGKSYGVPFSLLNNVVLYNKDVFSAAGINEVPKTWDEFMSACEKIKATGVFPIGLKNDSWASFIWFEAIVAAYDPQLYLDICDGTKPYNSDEMKEVLTIWKEMIDSGYFSDPVANIDHSKRFAVGEVAMVIEPQGFITGLQEDYGMVSGENSDAFMLPSMKEENKNIIFFEVAPMAIPSKSDKIEEAKAFVKSYYDTSVQEITLKNLGILLNSNVEAEDPTLKKIIDFTSDTENNTSILRYYENTSSDVRDVALIELAKFMDGKSDIETTLNTIQTKADEIFGE